MSSFGENAAEAVRRFMRAAYEVAETHPRLAYLAGRGTGRTYQPRSSSAWVSGEAMPPSDVLFALARAFPELSLDEFARGAVHETELTALRRELEEQKEAQSYLKSVVDELVRRVELTIPEEKPATEPTERLGPPSEPTGEPS